MTFSLQRNSFLFQLIEKNLQVKNYCLDIVLSFPGSHKKFENAVNDFHILKTSFKI